MPAFKLKIALRGSDPKITRTVAIPTDLTFADLHKVIQAAMPWDDYHLHEFCFPKRRLFIVQERGDPMFPRGDEEMEGDMLVADFHGEKFEYIYDFGDDWVHDITWLKDIPDYDHDYPKVLKYTGEAPPEDCGGIAGYAELLEILADPENRDHDDMKEWYGEPEPYDIDTVNDYFENFWTRAVPVEWLDADVLHDVAYIMASPTPTAYSYDRTIGAIVCIGTGDGEFDVAEPGAGLEDGRLVPIRPKVNSALFERCADFCEQMAEEGFDGFSGQRCGSKRDFDLIRRKVSKAGLEERFDGFLQASGYSMAEEWVYENGFSVDRLPGADPEDRLRTLMGVMSAMITQSRIEGHEFMCPGCGRMLKGEVDFSVIGMKLKGHDTFPVAIHCPDCRRRTLLAEMNDGFSLGMDYIEMGMPQRAGEAIIRATLDAEALEGPARAMRLADAAQEYTEFQKASRSMVILEEAMQCFDGVPSDDEGFDAYQRVLALMTVGDQMQYAGLVREVADRMHGDYGSLALAYLGSQEDDPRERARLMSVSEGMSDGRDLWVSLRAAYVRASFRKPEAELDADTVAGIRAVFDRYVDAVRSEEWRIGLKADMLFSFEDLYDAAYVTGAEIPGRDPADVLLDAYPEVRDGVNPVRCVALFRRALNRLNSGDEGGLEDAEELIRIVDDNRDFGPYCMVRCCFAYILAYWYGGRDRKDLEDAAKHFEAILVSGRADATLTNEFVNATMSAGVPDLGVDEMVEMLKRHGMTLNPPIPEASEMPEFDADLILSMQGPFMN